MTEHIKQTIADLQEKLRKHEAEAIETKKLINMLAVHAGMSAVYADAQLAPAGAALTIRADQFYGQPLVVVLRTILEMRKSRDQGPASVNELYDAMVEGGYKFETRDSDNAKRALRISITKNTAVFHRIPSGRVGLTEWYPNARQPKPKKAGAAHDDHEDLTGDHDEDGGNDPNEDEALQ